MRWCEPHFTFPLAGERDPEWRSNKGSGEAGGDSFADQVDVVILIRRLAMVGADRCRQGRGKAAPSLKKTGF
jgi:hypothetical protein